MTTEAWLVFGLFAFYLYDSVVLLAPREMILRCSAGGYALSSPYPYVTIRDRVPCVPNPLTPHRPLFRLSWADRAQAASATSSGRLDQARSVQRALRPLGVLTCATALLLLVALPGIVYRYGVGRYCLAALLAVYAMIGTMLVATHRQRHALGLSPRDFAAVAFDALACPPFALNLVRKLGLRQRLDLDPLEIAGGLPRAATADLWRSLKRRIDDELMLLTDDVDSAERLRALRADLEAKLA